MFLQLYHLREKIINFFNVAIKTNQKSKNIIFDYDIIWIFVTNFDLCNSLTNAFVKKLHDVEFEHFVANFNLNQRINNEINDVINFAKVNENLNLINFNYLRMFYVYWNIKMFLFFAVITFLKIDWMRAFVIKFFFQTFDASHANKFAEISRHWCKTRRKIFDIIRFFQNENNHNKKLTQKNRCKYKILQNN